MTEFETNKDLRQTLCPFDYWSSLVVLLGGHAQFLQHSLVGLLTLGYYLQQSSVVETVVVV